MKPQQIIGLMSGTSLDGLDIALCKFDDKQNQLNYQIQKAATLEYSTHWHNTLLNAHRLSGEALIKAHHAYGEYIGMQVKQFMNDNQIPLQNIDAVSSHGHTVFHQPDKKLTFQLGHGGNIANTTKLPVICDYRTQDIILGGQGAPLVPIGDRMLFGKYSYCLNLGGIANISLEHKGERLAWDICPANMVLNYLSRQKGEQFDKNGKLASKGKIIPSLIDALDKLEYYKKRPPKTLGREWVEQIVLPLIKSHKAPIEDKLATFTEHIAQQIAKITNIYTGDTMFITGGGAFNKFLIKQINKHTNITVILPEKIVIDFKEALIFALMGYLKLNNKPNILSSATGAKKNHTSGTLNTN